MLSQNKSSPQVRNTLPPLPLNAQGESTPSAAFDVDASYPWNSIGDGLLMEALDFPVVLVTGDSVAEVVARAVANGPLGRPNKRLKPKAAGLKCAKVPPVSARTSVLSVEGWMPSLTIAVDRHLMTRLPLKWLIERLICCVRPPAHAVCCLEFGCRYRPPRGSDVRGGGCGCCAPLPKPLAGFVVSCLVQVHLMFCFFFRGARLLVQGVRAGAIPSIRAR